MAKKRYYRKRRSTVSRVLAAALILLLGWWGLLEAQTRLNLNLHIPTFADVERKVTELYGYDGQSGKPTLSPAPLMPDGSPAQESASGKELELYMLDVGQGLSVFVREPSGQCALIDAGERSSEKNLLDFLRAQNVTGLDYLVATHGHTDHIGAMPAVVKRMKIGTTLISEVPLSLTPTSYTYASLLEALAFGGHTVTVAKPDTRYPFGDAEIQILGPRGEYGDLNNYSLVVRIIYKNTAFLITGDAERQSEEDIVDSLIDIRSNVLIAGHHGSSDASSSRFLWAVYPKYVGVSSGLGNDFGHPHESTLERIGAAGAAVLRTDLSGTVRFSSDGQTVQAQGTR